MIPSLFLFYLLQSTLYYYPAYTRPPVIWLSGVKKSPLQGVLNFKGSRTVHDDKILPSLVDNLLKLNEYTIDKALAD